MKRSKGAEMKVYRRYGQGTPKALDKKTRVLLAGLAQEYEGAKVKNVKRPKNEKRER